MRLDFNVLWVEDQPNNVQPTREALDRLMRKVGFRLDARFVTSVAGAEQFISDDIHRDHVDLVLMDYALGAGPNGEEGIRVVRQSLPYKEIVFYSAQDLTSQLQQLQLGGIYLSSREELHNVAFGVFETLVKKVLDIDHSRGIVMGASSDIDHYVFEALELLFSQGQAQTKSAILDIVRKRLKEIEKRIIKVIRELEKISDVKELRDAHLIYTSVDRANLLVKCLELTQTHSDKIDIIKTFVQNTIPQRNSLAHIRVEVSGFQRRLIDKRGDEFTSEHMRQLRIALIEAQETFEQIHRSLKTAAAS